MDVMEFWMMQQASTHRSIIPPFHTAIFYAAVAEIDEAFVF